jgi:hydrophobe/amphiphile efflux-1 (HAE1) family protein
MTFSHFFIDRPIFSTVLSILIVVLGVLSALNLPIEQYPQVAPPTIQVSATYPGASAETVAATVATPIEQEINGVENMIYMSSNSTDDGSMSLTISFEPGTDLDAAQVVVQNRVAIAEPRLPEEVRQRGITTRKNSPDLMLVINMFSPNGTFDQTFIGNYAVLQVRDQLARIDGVGDVRMFGASEYSMRIWLNPDLIQSFGMTPGDVLTALRAQNVQVAGGTLNQPPIPDQNAFQINIQTQGRLIEPEQFEDIIVKADEDGRIVHLRDVGRVELGALSYVTKGYLGDRAAVALPIFQRPGTNALETSDAIIATMDELAKDFPEDLTYQIVYNPTKFVKESIVEVAKTLLEAIVLVALVIILFLQTWRAAIIPVIAIPVSLIGTFAAMAALDISLNSLSLFGLVLAIGIVVDDAIVVVENMERLMKDKGLGARQAARETMTEVSSALVATSLVLVAVFLPTTFISGISGTFYQQFGLTIAVATLISTVVSLTLSPALAALILRPNDNDPCNLPGSALRSPVKYFFCRFNTILEALSEKYGRLVAKFVRISVVMLVVYGGLMGLAAYQFDKVPTGFIPPQDQGYFIVSIQLPSGASLERTDAVVQEAVDILLKMDGVTDAVAFTGFAGATFTSASNAAAIFPVLDTFEAREAQGLTYEGLLGEMQSQLSQIDEAFTIVIPPPPVPGIGNAGGFRMMLQDRAGRGLETLEGATWALAGAANQSAEVTSAFTFFEISTPQMFLDIDREKAERLGVPIDRVFEALEIYVGSSFVNDFNLSGRTYRVTAQADHQFRLSPDDVLRIRVRNEDGQMVPIGSVATTRDISGPSRVPRYNLYPAAGLLGNAAPGVSTGDALQSKWKNVGRASICPMASAFEWTEIAYQEKQTGNTAVIAFVLAVLVRLSCCSRRSTKAGPCRWR